MSNCFFKYYTSLQKYKDAECKESLNKLLNDLCTRLLCIYVILSKWKAKVPVWKHYRFQHITTWYQWVGCMTLFIQALSLFIQHFTVSACSFFTPTCFNSNRFAGKEGKKIKSCNGKLQQCLVLFCRTFTQSFTDYVQCHW